MVLMISVGSGVLLLGSIICFVIKKEKNQKTPLAGTEFFNLFFGVRFLSTALDGTRKLIILIYIYIYSYVAQLCIFMQQQTGLICS